MNYIMDKDQYIVLKISNGEWQLLDLKAGTHLATTQEFMQFDELEDAVVEMQKRYPNFEFVEDDEDLPVWPPELPREDE